MPSLDPIPQLPWQPESFVLGNLAIGNMCENMMIWLKMGETVHCETLLTAIGALTGFAAQHAALLRGADVTRKAGFVPQGSIAVSDPRNGQQFLIGNWINLHLYPEEGNKLSLFSFVAGAALQAGVAEKDLPNCVEIATHVAKVAGTPDLDVMRVPNKNQPRVKPTELLKALWPRVTGLLQLPSPWVRDNPEPPLSQLHWPIILSMVAANFIVATKDTLSPVVGSMLVMQAAVVAAKLSPTIISPGQWDISWENHRVSITRLKT